MAEQPFSSPSVGSLAYFRSKLQAPRGVRRIDALLAEDDAAAAVAALSPSDVFALVHEVGFEDAGDLIALATPAQLQGCLDFDGWDKDEFLPAAFHPWLTGVIEAGFEKVGEVWAGLDVEARMLFLQRNVEVYDVTLGEGPEDTEENDQYPMMTTPDSFFVLKLLGDDDAQRLTMRLIEDLYRADAPLARHTIQGARSEPAAELEEMSYRWRAGRLADLGYVDFYEALELFRPLDADQIKLGEDADADSLADVVDDTNATLPVAIAQEVLARAFLARALAELEDAEEIARIESAIMYLVNRVLAAARAKPGQQEVVQRAAHYASATLSLGLEAVAARGARASAESPAREVVGALSSPRPLWAKIADRPAGVGVRPFESLADVRRGTEVLSGLTVRVALVEQLQVNLLAMAQAPEPRPSLEDHLRTAMARAAMDGTWRSAALSATEVEVLRRDGFVDGALTSEARRRCHDAVAASLGAEQLLAGAATLPAIVDELLDQLEAVLGAVTDQRVDPRFISGVLIDAV
jgi:Family of unknown function (DUF6178)